MSVPNENSIYCAGCESYNIGLSSPAYCDECYKKKHPQKSLEEFSEFLADNCFDLNKYKRGVYDKKIFNWFK